MKKILFPFLLLLSILVCSAQSKSQFINVTVSPNSSDWNFKVGENVRFEVVVTKHNRPLDDAKVRYELSYDMMKVFEKEETSLKNGKASINGGTMLNPGFLRCVVYVSYDGKEYSSIATAGFSPDKIEPTITYPSDFNDFWNNAKKDNTKIPMKCQITPLLERSTDKVDVFHVGIQNYQLDSYIYGILSVPKAQGKYPAILQVPGAGVRPYNGDVKNAEKGFITLQIGIHGVAVNLEQSFYDDLRKKSLRNYQLSNWEDRNKNYYKRVYLGCIRAIDYIFSLDKFDGENIIVEGGSQGGALAIVTAALDNRVKGIVSYYPALSDITGYLYDRAGGWPHLFRNTKEEGGISQEAIEAASYYDVVNFARNVKVPGFYSFGYNDVVCPPTSVYSVINTLKATKSLFVVPETGHWTYSEQSVKADKWKNELLKE